MDRSAHFSPAQTHLSCPSLFHHTWIGWNLKHHTWCCDVERETINTARSQHKVSHAQTKHLHKNILILHHLQCKQQEESATEGIGLPLIHVALLHCLGKLNFEAKQKCATLCGKIQKQIVPHNLWAILNHVMDLWAMRKGCHCPFSSQKENLEIIWNPAWNMSGHKCWECRNISLDHLVAPVWWVLWQSHKCQYNWQI